MLLQKKKVLFRERRQPCSEGPAHIRGLAPFHCVVHQYDRCDVI